MTGRERTSWLGEFWSYRELFLFLVWRELKVRYKQTTLGAAWAVLQPLLLMAIFTLIGGKTGWADARVPGPLFYLSVLVPWTYFAAALTNAGNSLVANVDLLTKVYFPRAALPVSAVLAALVDFLVAASVLFGVALYYRVPVDAELLLWPLLALPLLLATLGAGMLFAALNVSFRDVKYALPFGIQLLLFLSPILAPLEIFPAWLQPLLLLNPLAGTLEAYRAALCPGIAVDWAHLAVSLVLSLGLFALGGGYFRRTERTFADLI